MEVQGALLDLRIRALASDLPLLRQEDCSALPRPQHQLQEDCSEHLHLQQEACSEHLHLQLGASDLLNRVEALGVNLPLVGCSALPPQQLVGCSELLLHQQGVLLEHQPRPQAASAQPQVVLEPSNLQVGCLEPSSLQPEGYLDHQLRLQAASAQLQVVLVPKLEGQLKCLHGSKLMNPLQVRYRHYSTRASPL